MRSRDEIKVFMKAEQKKLNVDVVSRAIAFAEFAHDGQQDKAGQEYIQHPMRVAAVTAKKYDNSFLTAIAYLHDVVEDGNITVSDLSAFFPKVIWSTVDVLTRRKSEDRGEYIKSIGENLLATQVKLADLEDNMDLSRLSFVSEKDDRRQMRYIDEYRYLTARYEHFKSTMSPDEMDPETYAEYFI